MTRPVLMGICNVNSDSFSAVPTAPEEDPVTQGLALVAAGAAVIDVGAQSASPSTPLLEPAEEIRRLEPVISALADRGVAVSVDTYKPPVAAAAIRAGATIINDYSGLAEPALLDVVTSHDDVKLVLTHNIGPIKQRLTDPNLYVSVVTEVIAWFHDRLATIAARGVDLNLVILDPGIDLSKTPAQTIEVLRGLEEIRAALPNELLIAISRKDFIGAATGVAPHGRDPGTLAALGLLRAVPGTIARVHDVAAAWQYLAVADLLDGSSMLGDSRLLPTALYRSDGAAAEGR